MKTKLAILMVLTLIMAQACTARGTDEASSSQDPAVPPALETNTPDTSPQTIQLTPVVSTAEPASTMPALGDIPTLTKAPQENSVIPEGGITLDDNGKTFTMHVGDSFLLNLGTDVYEWEVGIDNQDALRMKMGVMVIRGAQGIYDAQAPGTTTLSASGNPLCLQSRPACAMPSILFTVTIIVE